MAQVISCDVYDFSSAGNNFVTKRLTGIPVPAEFLDLRGTNLTPWLDSGVFVYSRIVYTSGGERKEALVAETVESLVTKSNA